MARIKITDSKRSNLDGMCVDLLIHPLTPGSIDVYPRVIISEVEGTDQLSVWFSGSPSRVRTQDRLATPHVAGQYRASVASVSYPCFEKAAIAGQSLIVCEVLGGAERSGRTNAACSPEFQSHRLSRDSEQSPVPESCNTRTFFQILKSSCNRQSQKAANIPTNGEHELAAHATADSRTSPKLLSSFPDHARNSVVYSVPAVPALSSVLSSLLNLSFYGENIIFDLKALEQDSRPIIELLKLTGSDCGNWMMVAAYYRRSGNARAAISVIEAMINGKDHLSIGSWPTLTLLHIVLVEYGFSENDLKPAFLFLSSCEADLAKSVQITEPHTANKHTRASHLLLQRVYGTSKTLPIHSRPTIHARTPCAPRQPRPEKTGIQPHDVATPGDKLPSSLPTPREKMLQREVQSLIDARNEQTMLLSSLKRKFEGDIAYERDGRRRLMRELEDLEKEVSDARKMEDFALSQAKREVDGRRKAEESVRAERTMRLELQKALEQRPLPSQSGLKPSTPSNSARRLSQSPG